MSGTNEQCRVLQFTNSNTSRLGSQRANTETWTKSSSQNSVAVADAALPPFTATPRRLCLTLRWRRQWRGGRSGPPWPSANALAGVCTSSPAPNVIDIVYVHGGRGRRRRIRSNRGTRDDKRTPLVCTVKSSRAFGFTPFSLSSP